MPTLNITKEEFASNFQKYLFRLEATGDELIVTSRKKTCIYN